MVMLRPKNPDLINNVKQKIKINYKILQKAVLEPNLSKVLSVPHVVNYKFKKCLKFIKSVSSKYKATVSPCSTDNTENLSFDGTNLQIQHILASHVSSKLPEFKSDCNELICDVELPSINDEIRDLSLTNLGVEMQINKTGLELWQVELGEVVKMFKRQRLINRVKKLKQKSNFYESAALQSDCGRTRSMSKAEPNGKKQRHEGYYYDHQLMGDDFFLNVVKAQLGGAMNKDPVTKILNIGHCISGLTIKQATEKARSAEYFDQNLIICIGYEDIMNGNSIEKIKQDLLDMVEAFIRRGISPTLCTLPPLLQDSENVVANIQIKRLNNFLTSRHRWKIIDLNRLFIRSDNILLKYYQGTERKFSGTKHDFILWNQFGRLAVLREIKKYIAKC